MRISDGSSDVCSSDLIQPVIGLGRVGDDFLECQAVRVHVVLLERTAGQQLQLRAVRLAPCLFGARDLPVDLGGGFLVATGQTQRLRIQSQGLGIGATGGLVLLDRREIGRASGRERVGQYV